MKILAFAGSLRKNSYNRMLLKAIEQLKPGNMEIEFTELNDIPLYNGDVEDEGVPEPVSKFKEKIKNSDGVIIATPEYNHAVSGVLKNALDWASRPPYNPFDNKAVGIVGASMGISGTISSQENLRHIGVRLNMHIMNTPAVLVMTAQDKFDETGILTDDRTKKSIEKFLAAFAEWVRKIKG